MLNLGIAGFFVYRIVQQLRGRAVNPDMLDPGRNVKIWLAALFAAFLCAALISSIALISQLGAVGAILSIAFVLVAAALTFGLAGLVWLRAEERRRSSGYLLCEAHYPDAPRPIKLSMRSIAQSAQSVRAGRARQDGMFGDVGIGRLAFDAAERAVLSSELSAAVRDLRPGASAEDRLALDRATAQIDDIQRQLRDTDEALKRAAAGANRLSERIAEPVRLRFAEQVVQKVPVKAKGQRQKAPVKAQGRRQDARSKLDDVTARATAKGGIDATGVEERIAAVSAGYDDVAELTKRVLQGPRLPGVDVQPTPPTAGEPATDIKRVARQSLNKAARSTGKTVARLSGAAVKAAAKKLKEQRDKR